MEYYLNDYRVILGFPFLIGILTSIYMYFDGIKYRKNAQKEYDEKMNNNVYINNIKNYIQHHMDGLMFEQFMGVLFTLSGNKVVITPSSHDFGKDIILNKDTYVECKCYKDSKVTSPMINKLLGAMSVDGITKGIFITTGEYTNDAKKIALKSKNKLECWDLDDILKLSLQCDRYKVYEFLGIK